MDTNEITNLVIKQGEALEALKNAGAERDKEIAKKGAADALVTEKMGRINDFLDTVGDAKQAAIMVKAADDRLKALESAIARTAKGAGIESGNGGAPEAKAYADAMISYMRKGNDEGLADLQRKSLSVGVDEDGGYTVTPAMSATIIKKVFESSPVRALASIETISTDSLDILDDHGEAGAGWTGETATVTETTSPTLAKRNIPTHELYAEPRATQKLLDDSSINIEQWLAQKVADIFGRTEATAFVSGNGVGKPRGFLSYASGSSWGQVEQINSGTSGSVTADGLIKLLYGLKAEYAQNAAFMLNRLAVRDVRLLKENTTNQYIWQPGLQAGQPDMLLGRPVYMASDMPVAAADSLSVAVADWRRAYQIVDRLGIRVLRDQFTAKPFVKFYTTKRVGGDVTNFEAIKLLKLAS
jgi:HK97 family phage major capsid protein